MQGQNPLDVEALAVANALDALRRFRLVGIVAGADDLRAGAGGKQHGGGARRQADDARRRGRTLQRVLRRSSSRDGGARARGRPQREQAQRARP